MTMLLNLTGEENPQGGLLYTVHIHTNTCMYMHMHLNKKILQVIIICYG
jgi:hypothetical protein